MQILRDDYMHMFGGGGSMYMTQGHRENIGLGSGGKRQESQDCLGHSHYWSFRGKARQERVKSLL